MADKSRPSRNAEAAEPGKRQAGAERERDANLPAQAERPGAERSGMVLPCLPIAGAALVRRKAGREEMAIAPCVGKVREEAYALGLSLMPRARREVCTLPLYLEGAEEAPPTRVGKGMTGSLPKVSRYMPTRAQEREHSSNTIKSLCNMPPRA